MQACFSNTQPGMILNCDKLVQTHFVGFFLLLIVIHLFVC